MDASISKTPSSNDSISSSRRSTIRRNRTASVDGPLHPCDSPPARDDNHPPGESARGTTVRAIRSTRRGIRRRGREQAQRSRSTALRPTSIWTAHRPVADRRRRDPDDRQRLPSRRSLRQMAFGIGTPGAAGSNQDTCSIPGRLPKSGRSSRPSVAGRASAAGQRFGASNGVRLVR